MSEQDRKYIFTEDAKKAMDDRNKRVTNKALNVNTPKRSNNNVLAATKAGPNKQMRPTEVQVRKVDTPKQVGKTTEVNGQTAKEADTQQNKKTHVRDTTKTQPNSIKHSESKNRYNCQQKSRDRHYNTEQNNNARTSQLNTTNDTNRHHKRTRKTNGSLSPHRSNKTHTSHTTGHHIRRGNRPLWHRREKYLP